MKLQEVLSRENNNLDLFRIIAAFSVIYGHSMGIMATPNMEDIFHKFFKHEYTAAVAVNSFFFLSGLVVTNSLLSRKSVGGYLVSRIFRIFPALIVVILISALIIGPIFSSLNFHDYFSNNEVFTYIRKNILLQSAPFLPGVFADHHKYSDVNIPLWTIRYEFFSYMFLLCIFVFGIFKNRMLATLVGLLIIVDSLAGNKFLFTWIDSSNCSLRFLSSAFTIGVLSALWKDKLEVNINIFLFSWLLYYLFKNHEFNYLFFHIAFFASIIFISSRKAVVKLKPKADISYGVYLWGWPVQQMLISIFPQSNSIFNASFAIPISAAIAVLSWVIIEKPSIHFGKRLCDKIKI